MKKSTAIDLNTFKFENLFCYLLLPIALSVLALFRHGSFLIPIFFGVFGLLQFQSLQSFKTDLLTSFKNPIWYTCAVFTILCFLSTLWSVTPIQTFMGSFQLIGLLCFYLLLLTLIPRFYKIKPKMWFTLLISFMGAGIIIWFAEKNIFNIRHFLGMHYRVYKPNVELLSILAIPLFFYLYNFVSRILSVAFALLTLYLCIVSDIRASFYGLIMGALSIPFWYYRSKFSSLLASFGLVLYAITLPLGVYIFNYQPHVQWFIKNQGASFLHRLMIWKFTAEKTWEKLFLGWGAMTSKNFPEEVHILPFEGSETWPALPSHPHNIFMQVWLELGALGMTIFLLFWYFCFKGVSKIHSPLKRTALGMLLTSVVPMLSLSHSLWHTWWISWIVFGVFLCRILPDKD